MRTMKTTDVLAQIKESVDEYRLYVSLAPGGYLNIDSVIWVSVNHDLVKEILEEEEADNPGGEIYADHEPMHLAGRLWYIGGESNDL